MTNDNDYEAFLEHMAAFVRAEVKAGRLHVPANLPEHGCDKESLLKELKALNLFNSVSPKHEPSIGEKLKDLMTSQEIVIDKKYTDEPKAD